MSDYHIFNRDCIENIDLINDSLIDSVIIDPPYCQTHTGLPNQYEQANIEFDRKKFFDLASKKCKKDATFGIWGYGETLYRDIVYLIDNGWKFNHEFVWNKGIGSLPTHKIPKMHETFIVLTRGNKIVKECFVSDFYSNCNITKDNFNKLNYRYNTLLKVLKKLDMDEIKLIIENINNGYVMKPKGRNEELNTNILDDREVFIRSSFKKRIGTVIDISRQSNRLHPTQKPDVLMSVLVKMLSDEGDLIVDFFMGSGSTGIAALQNNRDFVGFEIYKEYFDIAEKRIRELKSEKKLF